MLTIAPIRDKRCLTSPAFGEPEDLEVISMLKINYEKPAIVTATPQPAEDVAKRWIALPLAAVVAVAAGTWIWALSRAQLGKRALGQKRLTPGKSDAEPLPMVTLSGLQESGDAADPVGSSRSK